MEQFFIVLNQIGIFLILIIFGLCRKIRLW